MISSVDSMTLVFKFFLSHGTSCNPLNKKALFLLDVGHLQTDNVCTQYLF